MTQVLTENALRDSLAKFETSVTTPLIAGELSTWMKAVAKCWSEVSQQIQRNIRQAHPKQYQEIADADAALLRQVDLLRAEDHAIEDECEKLDQTITRMAEHLPRFEPDEAKARPHIQSLMESGVALVARVRKQEVALQTWFSEAFHRERGGGD